MIYYDVRCLKSMSDEIAHQHLFAWRRRSEVATMFPEPLEKLHVSSVQNPVIPSMKYWLVKNWIPSLMVLYCNPQHTNISKIRTNLQARVHQFLCISMYSL